MHTTKVRATQEQPILYPVFTHDCQAFVEITAYALDQHEVVNIPGQHVAVDLQQIEGLTTYTKEFRVFVKDNGVAESISELYFHDGGSKRGCIGTGDWFKCAKRTHSTTGNNVSF